MHRIHLKNPLITGTIILTLTGFASRFIGFFFFILPYRKAVRTEAVAANERIYYYDKEVFILTLTQRCCRNGKRRRAIA